MATTEDYWVVTDYGNHVGTFKTKEHAEEYVKERGQDPFFGHLEVVPLSYHQVPPRRRKVWYLNGNGVQKAGRLMTDAEFIAALADGTYFLSKDAAQAALPAYLEKLEKQAEVRSWYYQQDVLLRNEYKRREAELQK